LSPPAADRPQCTNPLYRRIPPREIPVYAKRQKIKRSRRIIGKIAAGASQNYIRRFFEALQREEVGERQGMGVEILSNGRLTPDGIKANYSVIEGQVGRDHWKRCKWLSSPDYTSDIGS